MDHAALATTLDIITTHAGEDHERRATAYAALTLARVLSPEWTHSVTKRDGKTSVHETVVKPAGQLFGVRSEVEARLSVLLGELGGT